ncbi:Protein p74 [Frankliniella fusca]|uniref:Protein p74 n=1 Tax=Frankliniella fusca TaxID=407009 RepID=A0AAE1H2I1_9NEOP|nr:Protein p74 [Frankliniella fusca]
MAPAQSDHITGGCFVRAGNELPRLILGEIIFVSGFGLWAVAGAARGPAVKPRPALCEAI